MPFLVFLLLNLCSFHLINPARASKVVDPDFQVVPGPNINWNSAPYKPTPLGDRRYYHGSATFYDYANGSTGMCGYPENFLSLEMNYLIAATPFPRFNNPLTPNVSQFLGAACGQCYHIKCLPKPYYQNFQFCVPNHRGITVRITDWDFPKTTENGSGIYPDSGGWPNNHFDLNKYNFAELADLPAGIINIMFKRVPCVPRVGPRWTLAEDSNGYWRDLIVFDVGGVGNVVAVYATPTNTNYTFTLQWIYGAHYQFAAWEGLVLDANSHVWATVAEQGGANVTLQYENIKDLETPPPPSPPHPPPSPPPPPSPSPPPSPPPPSPPASLLAPAPALVQGSLPKKRRRHRRRPPPPSPPPPPLPQGQPPPPPPADHKMRNLMVRGA